MGQWEDWLAQQTAAPQTPMVVEGFTEPAMPAQPPAPEPLPAIAPPPEPTPVPLPPAGPAPLPPPPQEPLDMSQGFIPAFQQATSRPEYQALETPADQWEYINLMMDQDPVTAELEPKDRLEYLDLMAKDFEKKYKRATTIEGQMADVLHMDTLPTEMDPSDPYSQLVVPMADLAKWADKHPRLTEVPAKVARFAVHTARSVFGDTQEAAGKVAEGTGRVLDFLADVERKYKPDSKLAQVAEDVADTMDLWSRGAKASAIDIKEQLDAFPLPTANQISDLKDAKGAGDFVLKTLDVSVNTFLDSLAGFAPAVIAGGPGGALTLSGQQFEEARLQGVDLDPFIGLISGTAQMALESVAGPEKLALEISGATSLRAIKSQLKRSAVKVAADLGTEITTEMAQNWVNMQVPKWSKGEAGIWLNLSKEQQKEILMSGLAAGIGFGPVMALRADLQGRAEKKQVETLEKIIEEGALTPRERAAKTLVTTAPKAQLPTNVEEREIRHRNVPAAMLERDDADEIQAWVEGKWSPPEGATPEETQEAANAEATIQHEISPAPIPFRVQGDRSLDYAKKLDIVKGQLREDLARQTPGSQHAGEAQAAIDTVQFVQPQEPWMQELQGIGDAMGVEVLFYDNVGNDSMLGLVNSSDPTTVFMRYEALTPGLAIASTFIHELTHSSTREDAGVRTRLSARLSQMFPDQWKQAEARAASANTPSVHMQEETLAYFMGLQDPATKQVFAEKVLWAIANYDQNAKEAAAGDLKGFAGLVRSFQAFLIKVTKNSEFFSKMFKDFTKTYVPDKNINTSKAAKMIVDEFRAVTETRKKAGREAKPVQADEMQKIDKARVRGLPAGFEPSTAGRVRAGDKITTAPAPGRIRTVKRVDTEDGSTIIKFEDGQSIHFNSEHLVYRGGKDAGTIPPEYTAKKGSDVKLGDQIFEPKQGVAGTVGRVTNLGGGQMVVGLTGSGTELVIRPSDDIGIKGNERFVELGKVVRADNGLDIDVNIWDDDQTFEITVKMGDHVVLQKQTNNQEQAMEYANKVADMDLQTVYRLSGAVAPPGSDSTPSLRSTKLDDGDPATVLGGRFWSPVYKALEKNEQKTWKPKALYAWLKKQPNVKDDELYYSGMEEWLSTREDDITREEAIDFIATHHVQVHELVLQDEEDWMKSSQFGIAMSEFDEVEGALIDELAENVDMTRAFMIVSEIKAWVRDDTENKMPDIPEGVDPGTVQEFIDAAVAFYEASNSVDLEMQNGDGLYYTQHEGYQLPGEKEDYREIVLFLPDNDFEYPLHWSSQKGVLAWVRFSTRYDAQGRKVMFIEEIQSDLHQQGAKFGYAKKGERDGVDPRVKHLKQLYLIVRQGDLEIGPGIYITQEEMEAKREEMHELADLLYKEYGIPDSMALNEFIIENTKKKIPDAPFKNKEWSKLTIKRAIAHAAENGFDAISWTTSQEQVNRWEGVGEKQLRQYYDEILPNQIKKLGKRHGAKLEDLSIRQLDGNAVRVYKEDSMWRVDVNGRDMGGFSDEVDAKAVAAGYIGKSGYYIKDRGEGMTFQIIRRSDNHAMASAYTYEQALKKLQDYQSRGGLRYTVAKEGDDFAVVRDTNGNIFRTFQYDDMARAVHLAEQLNKDAEKAESGSAVRTGIALTDQWRKSTIENKDSLFSKRITTANTVDQSEMRDWESMDWKEYGKKHGVPNMGGMSDLKVVGEVKLPGGTEGTWTYEELLWMQHQGFDPNSAWTEDQHVEVIKKLHRTLTPENLEPLGAMNQLVFALMSPSLNINLNELNYSLLRMRNEQEVGEWAARVPWDVTKSEGPGRDMIARMDKKTKAAFRKYVGENLEDASDAIIAKRMREFYNNQINSEFGIQKESRGGMGMVGKGQTSNIAEMAQLFQVDPEFFLKRDDESWHVTIQRFASQFRGLSNKTAIFGAVWQDPLNAMVAAIDRHMAEIFQNVIIEEVGRVKFEDATVKLYKKKNPKTKLTNFDEIMVKSPGIAVEALLGVVSTATKRVYKAELDALSKYIVNPSHIVGMGKAYRIALEENAKQAKKLGIGPFSMQHLLWDRERSRFETHAAMFPGLYKVPHMTQENAAEIKAEMARYGRSSTAQDTSVSGETRLRPVESAPLGALSFAAQRVESLPFQQASPSIDVAEDSAPMYYIPDETWTTWLRRKVVDKFFRVMQLQRVVSKDMKREIPDHMNIYLNELVYHGKAADRVERLEEEYVQPLIDHIKENKISVSEFEMWLYARHAKERNDQYEKQYRERAMEALEETMQQTLDEIEVLEMEEGDTQSLERKYNRLKKRLKRLRDKEIPTSGMTTAQAQTILEAAGDKFNDAAELFDKMMDRKLDVMLEYGLISEELHTKLRETYEFYVPLKGKELEGDLEDLISDHEGIGSGFDIRGDEVGRSFGRMAGELATHPILSQAIVDIEAAIIRGEKNIVGQALLDFVKEFPDASLYEVNKKVRRRVLDRKTGTVKFVQDALAKRAPNVVSVKRDGETYFIHLKDTRLAMAMKNIGSTKHGNFIKFLAAVNRIMAKINTTLDPEFVLSNFARDIQTALVHLNEEQADGIAYEAMKGLPAALRGISSYEFGDRTEEWAQYYDEFKKNGGKIGFFGYNDVVSLAKALDNELKRAGGGAKNLTVSQIIKVGKIVERANSIVENGIRLSAYVAARKAGASELKAAVLARELTVNFNKKGEWGATMNAFWLFSNASVQGTARMFTALWRSKRVKAMASMQFMSSFLMSALNQGMGGDDEEDGTPYYEKLPDWIKERNVVVMLPESKGSYIKIPLPYGYNVFNVIGVEAWKMFYAGKKGQSTKKQTMKSAISVADAMLGAFSPFGSARLDSPYGVFRQAVPSILAPIADSLRNETYYGAPIQPTRSSWDNSPNSQRYFESVSDTSRVLAEWANKMTGGNAYQPGFVDVNPEVIDYLFSSYSGAATKTAGRVTETLYTLLSGADFSETEANDVTFLRRIYGEQNDHSVASVFYENIEDVSQAKEAWENLSKEPGFDRRAWRKSHGWKQRLFDDMGEIQNRIRKESDPDKKNKLRKRFNKLYRRAWESQF